MELTLQMSIPLDLPVSNIILLQTKSNATLCQIVGGQLDLDPVSRHQADVVFAHTPAHVSNDIMTVFKLHPKLGVWQRLNNLASKFNNFLIIGRTSRLLIRKLFYFFLTSHKLLHNCIICYEKRKPNIVVIFTTLTYSVSTARTNSRSE